MTWGVESHIVKRFGQAEVPAENITLEKDTCIPATFLRVTVSV